MSAPSRVNVGDDVQGIHVTVDGDTLRDVVAYDIDEGWVLVIKHDDDGKRVAEGQCWLGRKVYGEVRATKV